MSRIVDVEPLLKKYDRLNEGTEFSPIHFINDLMVLKQLLYTEKEELLRVGKGAVKSRQGRFVIYDVEWLKEHFYSTEEKIYGQPKQPCEDCISREALLSKIKEVCFSEDWVQFRSDYGSNGQRDFLINYIEQLPPVTPERPKGKWIEIEIDAGEFIYKCTECGMRVINPYKYCPNCGSYNGGKEDEVND